MKKKLVLFFFLL